MTFRAWILPFFALMTGPGVSIAQVDPLACEAARDRAEQIHDLRDVNAGEGAAQGVTALESLRSTEENCQLGEALLLRAIAANLDILAEYEKARSRIEQALTLLESTDGVAPGDRAAVHLTAGTIYWDLEAHDEAIAHYLASLRASEAADDLVGAGRAAGNIGNLYSTIGEMQRARDYHERALERFRVTDWETGIAGTLVNLAALAGRMARAAQRRGDAETAAEEFQRMHRHGLEALERFAVLENPRGVAHATTNLATALEGLGRVEEALDYLTGALEIQRQVGDVSGEVQVLLTLARTHAGIGDHDAASDALELAASRVSEDSPSLRLAIEELRVELASDRGDFASALEHQQRVTGLHREISQHQMAARVEEVRMAMDAERREQEIELLKSEAEIAELQMNRQRLIIAGAVVTSILLAMLLLLVYSRYRVRVKATRQLDVVARTDPLTGLPNRRDMGERLSAAHRKCALSGSVHGLVMADIDSFKMINDRYGHDTGDEILRQLAELLSISVKGRDVVARWGGEEFLLLLPDTDLAGARSVAENLRQVIADTRFDTDEGRFEVTLTLGVTVLDGQVSVDQAIRRADQAMYRGKRGGGNRTECQPEIEFGQTP